MGNRTVVIADDEPHLVHILAYSLRKAGIIVETAANGAECVALAARVRPDLIVSDYQMPILDGLHACIQLKQDSRTAGIPVIMLTARGHRLTADELAATSIAAVLPKPFSARVLLAKIEEVLAAPNQRMAA